jgi:hypothetical protein
MEGKYDICERFIDWMHWNKSKKDVAIISTATCGLRAHVKLNYCLEATSKAVCSPEVNESFEFGQNHLQLLWGQNR